MNIYLENITKSYYKNKKKVPILQNFSYDFETNKKYLIKGHSGCGKTTLLSLIALLDDEFSGKIYYNDQCVSQLSSEKKCLIRSKDIGIIFQDSYLFPGMTVLDNILLPDICEKRTTLEKSLSDVEALLDKLSLKHRINHFPEELSGGERQRVCIARAILKKPKLLVADEPVSSVDSKNKEQIVNLLIKLSEELSCTLVVASHDNIFDDIVDDIVDMEAIKEEYYEG